MRHFLSLTLVLISFGSFAQSKTPPTIGYEYIPDVSDSVLEARLKAIEGDIPLHFTEDVKKYINYYTVSKRDYARKMLNRSSKYFPLFEEYLARNNMPDELKYLSVVESGLNPNAVSHAAAVGLWQFIYWTGKKYDLNSSWYIDDRMDPDKSTQAACGFLGYLYGYFGDWELALAGYNSGPGRVNRAIRYADGQRDFLSIYRYLPNETKAYVPKFVAVTYLFKYAEEHNLYPSEEEYIPEYDTIHVSQYFHLDTFVKQTEICLEDLEKLNPQIKHGAIPATARNYPLKIPAELKESIVANRQNIYDSAGSVGKEQIEKMAKNEIGAVAGRERVVHSVKSGDVLGTIAQRYHVRVSDIKKWNRLNGSMIKIGQKLKVWVLPKYKNSAPKKTLAKAASTPPKPKPGQKTYAVKSGDTLWDISKDNKISIEKLKSLNNLSNNSIKPGQTLIVSAE